MIIVDAYTLLKRRGAEKGFRLNSLVIIVAVIIVVLIRIILIVVTVITVRIRLIHARDNGDISSRAWRLGCRGTLKSINNSCSGLGFRVGLFGPYRGYSNS